MLVWSYDAAFLVTSMNNDPSLLFIELGCAIVGLAIVARIANRLGFSAIPLYLIAGSCVWQWWVYAASSQ